MICFLTVRFMYSHPCTPLWCRFNFKAAMIPASEILSFLFDLRILEWICFDIATQQSKDVVVKYA